MNNLIQLSALNQKEALRYLGYKDCIPDAKVQQMLDECEKQLLLAARPKIVYRCFDIEKCGGAIAVKGTDLCLTGNSISELLDDCDKAVFLCATLSAGVDRLLHKTQIQDMALAVVMDSLANAAIEQVCGMAEELIAGEFDEYYQTWRFGIGYGDLPLTLQNDFLKVLDANKRVGVYAAQSSLLTPGKSVTCIIGLSQNPLPKKKRGCQTCNMRKNCRYKEAGTGCNLTI